MIKATEQMQKIRNEVIMQVAQTIAINEGIELTKEKTSQVHNQIQQEWTKTGFKSTTDMMNAVANLVKAFK